MDRKTSTSIRTPIGGSEMNSITKYITPEMIDDMQKEIRLKINEWSKVKKQTSEIFNSKEMRIFDEPYISLNKLEDEIKYYVHVLDTILTNGYAHNMKCISGYQRKYSTYKKSEVA